MSSAFESCGGGDRGTPLVAGTLRGYRAWTVPPRRAVDEGLPLAPLRTPSMRWTPTMRAACDTPAAHEADHAAPVHGCGCGLYGWYRPRDVLALPGMVFGVVDASGRVLVGDRGFRAEQARIRAVVTRSARVARGCRDAGIEVFASRRQLLRAYPPDDVSELVGKPPRPRVRPAQLAPAAVPVAAMLAIAVTTALNGPALVAAWCLFHTVLIAAFCWRVVRR